MGRMKHGKPQPHANKKKVVLKPHEVDKQSAGAARSHGNDGFNRRVLDSNHDRYDEPEHSEDSDEEEVDETKSIEYIKKHYSGVSSHFQFEQEKEWETGNQESSGNEKEFLHLDLNQLAEDFSTVGIFEKLQLDEGDSQTGYCVANLAHLLHDTNPNIKIHRQESKSGNLPFEWSHKGLENYQPRKKPARQRVKLATAVHDMEKKSVQEEPPQVQPPEITGNIQQAGPVPTKKESSICTEEEEFDLDELLLPNTQESSDDKLENVRLQESGAKELDDWLDSILD